MSHYISGLVAFRGSEQQGRLVDPDQIGSMNKKKRKGF